MSTNPLADLVGNFLLGLLDGALKKYLAQYVAPGKLTQGDVATIVAGVHADVKLGLIMQETKPAAA